MTSDRRIVDPIAGFCDVDKVDWNCRADEPALRDHPSEWHDVQNLASGLVRNQSLESLPLALPLLRDRPGALKLPLTGRSAVGQIEEKLSVRQT